MRLLSCVATASTDSISGDHTGVVGDVGVRPSRVGIETADDVGGLAVQSTTHVMCKLRTTINC